VIDSTVRRHRCSQGGQKDYGTPRFFENIVILCFEKRFSKQNSVNRLKSYILPTPQIFGLATPLYGGWLWEVMVEVSEKYAPRLVSPKDYFGFIKNVHVQKASLATVKQNVKDYYFTDNGVQNAEIAHCFKKFKRTYGHHANLQPWSLESHGVRFFYGQTGTKINLRFYVTFILHENNWTGMHAPYVKFQTCIVVQVSTEKKADFWQVSTTHLKIFRPHLWTHFGRQLT